MFADLFSPLPALRYDRAFGELMRAFAREEAAAPLAVDVRGDEVIVTAFVPGCSPEDLQVQVEDHDITISGSREMSEAEPQGVRWRRRERESNQWSETIAMPFAIDPERVAADLEDGVLVVRLSRSGAAKPRAIDVKPRDAKREEARP
jgi:HSP20 family protein